jgi:hypothetical protein
MDDRDPYDSPESVYEAAVFLGCLFSIAAIALAALLWLVWR